MYVSRLPAHQGAGQYYDSLTAEIAALLDAAHGHALVLFTSYAAMSAVKERLREQDLAYQLFTLGRNAVHTTKQFKNTPGGVLLATGAAWEGFDFRGLRVSPGDPQAAIPDPRRTEGEGAGAIPNPPFFSAGHCSAGDADQIEAGLWPGHPPGDRYLRGGHSG